MAEQPQFQKAQLEFTAHIRNPIENPKPAGIEDRRMGIYRDLLFNNVNSFLENGFPVLRSLYDDEQWTRIARLFFAEHQSETPYFARISQEFLNFLENEYTPSPIDPPYMLELAHYEWAELALSIDTATIDMEGIDHHGDLLKESPVVSPLIWNLSYQWPVHTISTDQRPEGQPEQPTHLMVYRDAEDTVGFIEANPVTARLMQLLQEMPGYSGEQYLSHIAEEMNHPEPETVIQGGLQILLKWRSSDIVLGTKPPTSEED